MSRELRVFTGTAHPTLGEAIARSLSVPLGRAHLARFSEQSRRELRKQMARLGDEMALSGDRET